MQSSTTIHHETLQTIPTNVRPLKTTEISPVECTVLCIFFLFGVASIVLVAIFFVQTSTLNTKIDNFISIYNANAAIISNTTFNCSNSTFANTTLEAVKFTSKLINQYQVQTTETYPAIASHVYGINAIVTNCTSNFVAAKENCTNSKVSLDTFNHLQNNLTAQLNSLQNSYLYLLYLSQYKNPILFFTNQSISAQLNVTNTSTILVTATLSSDQQFQEWLDTVDADRTRSLSCVLQFTILSLPTQTSLLTLNVVQDTMMVPILAWYINSQTTRDNTVYFDLPITMVNSQIVYTLNPQNLTLYNFACYCR
jgi:hypothetical protein